MLLELETEGFQSLCPVREGYMLTYRCRFGTYSILTDSEASLAAGTLKHAPLTDNATLYTTREPDFFAYGNPFGNSAVVMGKTPRGVPMLIFELREYPINLAGKTIRAVYCSFLKVPSNPARHRGIFEHGFIAMRQFARRLGFADRYYTSIDLSNIPLRKTLESGSPRLPRYTVQGDMEITITGTESGQIASKLPTGYTITQATPEDAVHLPSLLVGRSTVWSYSTPVDEAQLSALLGSDFHLTISDFVILKHQGLPIGCVCVWDQKALRQHHIQHYPATTGFLRPLKNIWAGLTQTPFLPSIGSRVNLAFLAFFILHARHAPFANALLRHALYIARTKGIEFCALGLAESNILRHKTGLHGISYRSRVYSIRFEGKPEPGGESTFVPQPEIALM